MRLSVGRRQMVEKVEFDMGPIDCMACLVALSRSKPYNDTYQDASSITHATYWCSSYGTYRALTCTFRRDGRLQLVRFVRSDT